jgi:type I restriction enzyme M protein
MTPRGGVKPHKKFSIQAKRSEVLFVDYIMEHLNPNGKAGIIVPEGIIFQSATAYKALRKMMIDQNFLYAVISLPAGIFQPYSGVKTSILFMDRVIAKKTKDILFVKVENDGFDLGAQRRPIDKNDLPKAEEILKRYKLSIQTGKPFELSEEDKQIASLVPIEKISKIGDYNLSGDRYKETKVAVNQKWPIVELKDVAKVGSGDSAPQEEKYFKDGCYPFFRTSDVGLVHLCSELISSRDKLNELAIKELNLKLQKRKTILFPKSGASTFLNHRVILGVDGYVSSHLATIQSIIGKIIPEFLFYLLCFVDAKELTEDQNYPSLRLSDIEKIEIPLPPLEVQQEIVSHLDSYQKIIDGAKQIVDNYKPEIKIDPSWPVKTLGEIITLQRGYDLPKTQFINGSVPVVGSNGIIGYHNEEKEKGPGVVTGRSGTIGKVHYIDYEYYWPHNTALFVKEFNGNDRKFIKFILESIDLKSLGDNVSAVPSLDRKNAHRISVSIPPLNIQKQIVARIEEEQQIVDANKKMIDLYQGKIKEKINEVWG